MTRRFQKITVAELIKTGEAEVKTGPFGTQLHASDYQETGTPVINVRNIGFGNIREEKLEFISDDTVRRLSSHLLRPEDIVFGRKGAVERHVYIQPAQANWFQGSDCLRLRLKSARLVPRFASYYFLTHEHQQWMMGQCSHGATMASLNQDIISRIELPCPSIAIQFRIASVLSAYDDLIENNTRRIAILEEMARRIYEEWFVRFRFPGHEQVKMVESELGSIPANWEPAAVDQCVTVHRGKSYKGSELADEGGIPFVNLKCMERDGGFRKSGLKRYTGTYKDTHKVVTGDLVMAVTDMTQERRIVARCGRVPRLGADFGVISMDLVKIEANKGIPKDHMYGMFRWSGFADEVKQHANGANVLHLLPDRISDYRFVRPPAMLMQRYADMVGPMLSQCDVLTEKNEVLRTTRDLLLPKLISGDLDVSQLSA